MSETQTTPKSSNLRLTTQDAREAMPAGRQGYSAVRRALNVIERARVESNPHSIEITVKNAIDSVWEASNSKDEKIMLQPPLSDELKEKVDASHADLIDHPVHAVQPAKALIEALFEHAYQAYAQTDVEGVGLDG